MKTLSSFIRTPMRTLALALTLWLAVLPQANAAITPAWKQWAQRPSRVRVDFSMVFQGTTNAIRIGDTVLGFGGTNCDLYCTSAVASAWITPNKPTRLSLEGHLHDAQFWMQPQQPLNLDLIQRLPDGRPLAAVAADRYRLFLNGVECTGLTFKQGDECVIGATNWQLEMRLDADQRRANTRGRDQEIEVAENSAPGDGDWPAIGPAQTQCFNETAVRWSVGLGRLLGGKSAGRIKLSETGLGPEIYTPRALTYDQPITNLDGTHERIVVVTNLEGELQQILAPQTLVNIVNYTNATNQVRSYDLEFHRRANVDLNTSPSNGPFTLLTHDPHVVWRFFNPDVLSTNYNHLRIEEEHRDGVVYASDIQFDGSNTWSLTRGTGADQRLETRAISFTNDASGNLYRVELNEVTGVSNRLAFRCAETYRFFDWGCALISVATDTGSEWLTQTFDYYTDVYAPASCGKVRCIRYPDGYWEKRFYHDGTHYASWADAERNPEQDGELAWVLTPCQNGPTDPSEVEAPDWSCTGNDDTGTNSCHGVWYRNEIYWHDDGSQQESFQPIVTCALGNGATIVAGYAVGFLAQFQCSVWESGNPVQRQSTGVTLRNRGGERVVDFYATWASSEVAGQVYRAQSNYTLVSTNLCQFGGCVNGAFSPGAGRAWRCLSDHGIGFLDRNDLNFDDWWSLIPGQSSRDCLVRQDGAVVLRECYACTSNSLGATMTLLSTDYFTNDCLGHPVYQVRVDGAASGAGRVVHAFDWQGSASLPGCLLLAESDEDGRTTSYTYDSLKRLQRLEVAGAVTAGFSTQASVRVTFTYDAMNRLLRSETNAGGLALANAVVYDLNGRVAAATNHQGLLTLTSYPDGGRVNCTTLPTGALTVQSNYLSRQLGSVTGDAQVPQYYDYQNRNRDSTQDPGPTGATATNDCVLGEPGSGRFQRSVRNSWGALVQEARPSPNGEVVTDYHMRFFISGSFDTFMDGLVAAAVSPGPASACGGSIFYAYDAFRNLQHLWTPGTGAPCDSIDPLNLTNAPDLLSTDRVFTTNRTFEISGQGDVFWTVTGLTYLTNHSGSPTVLAITKTRLSGLPANVKSEITTIDVDGRTQVETTYVDRDAAKVTIVTSASWSSLCATQIWVNGLLQSESTFTVAQPTVYGYDALRRPTSVTSPLGAVSRTGYSPTTGQVLSTTDFAGNVTTYQYYPTGETGAGKIKGVTRPDGKKTYYAYTNLQDLLVRTWGDVPYPEERVYNQFAELVELHTYRGGSGWGGASWPANPGTNQVTTWNYDTSSGLLLSKTDALSNSVNYTYWANGALASVTRRAGTSTSYAYGPNGDLAAVDQTEGLTNTPCATGTSVVHHFSEFQDYTRAGQPARVLEYDSSTLGSATCLHRDQAFAYDAAGRTISEVGGSGSWFSGLTINNHYDPSLGRDSLTVSQGGSNVLAVSYGYDGYGRMNAVTSGPDTAEYTYKPNSDLIAATTFRHSGAQVLVTTKTWDIGQRLQSIANMVNNAPVTSHAYTYDALHRRTRALLEDGSSWRYGYNGRDELIGGKRYWSGSQPVAGQQFEYTYDNIGNRTTSKSGGDERGAGLRPVSYSVNDANEYTTVATPGYKDIIGVALNDNSVTVNGGPADRRQEYFHREVAVDNSSGPAWQATTIGVTNGGTGSGTNGGFVWPASSQTLAYDASGNLTFDGIWQYRWNSENRLTEMVMANVANIPAAQRKKLEFTYDNQGRRISKRVSQWNANSNAFFQVTNYLFLYDGCNLLAILTSDLRPQTTFTWGLDLSGSEDGAGGIGGLLFESQIADPQISNPQYACYDGSGNLTALVQTDGSQAARYDYSPFGEPIRATGALAEENPFRCSTKFRDKESGLACWGTRFSSLVLGRWLSKDSTGESGGLNLYILLANNPANNYDRFGGATEAWVKTGVDAWLASVGSKSTYDDLIPKPELGGRYYLDRDTKRVIRLDMTDACHGNKPNIHIFDSMKDAKNGKSIGKQEFQRGTGRLLPMATITFGIGSIMALDAAVSSGLYADALAAARSGDREEAQEKMFELSIEMSVESGSMVPFYSINAVMGNAGPKQSSDSE